MSKSFFLWKFTVLSFNSNPVHVQYLFNGLEINSHSKPVKPLVMSTIFVVFDLCVMTITML